MSKMFDYNQLTPKHIQTLSPYQSARRLGGNGDVWLNANELAISVEYSLALTNLNRYPEAQPSALINAYASYTKVAANQILVTRGADEGIELLIKAFCTPLQDSIMYCPPTYGMYEVSAKTLAVNCKVIPSLANWQLDLEQIKNNLATVKVIYICNPNNPTGNLIPLSSITELLTITQQQAIVVLDQAYLEFYPDADCAQLLTQFKNLVILRTLSKAFGLAAIRCGFIIANPEIIAIIAKVIAPYPIATVVADIAYNALQAENIATMRQQVKQINQAKNDLIQALSKLAIIDNVYPSFANYILINSRQAANIFQTLHAQGIIVRDQSNQFSLENCLRISIGNQNENSRLLQALQSI